ncbi:MAG: response regulator [Ignavibacteriaceae bacterium]
MGRAKVLIVEDETITALGIKKDIENAEEISVSIVNNAVDAVITAQKEKPDVIIMDIMLKGQLNGIEAAEIISGKYNIPIIYLTAYHDDETYLNAHMTNPVKIINKPYNKSELIGTINDVIVNC